jgi:hypothetical protein
MVFLCLLNGSYAIASFITAVRSSSFKKVSDGTAHGGTVVNDKDSGRARGVHLTDITTARRLRPYFHPAAGTD